MALREDHKLWLNKLLASSKEVKNDEFALKEVKVSRARKGEDILDDESQVCLASQPRQSEGNFKQLPPFMQFQTCSRS